ncbi:dihydrolipoamide acetyltransferase family protein [Streptomyces sp. B21-105]|uniref:dihydrolipoamide acetyltransferase family protein n=1 Tax=Streptomyces sp. B21-105 TaxID=3039417 RepID=UPI002FF2D4F7|nr:2-oxo acid dehydrogenase subunit E2 [Streptomyces canus]
MHSALVSEGSESGEKHGSRIRSPAVQRQASVRIVDSAVPKQEPLARSVMVMPVAGVPPGDQGPQTPSAGTQLPSPDTTSELSGVRGSPLARTLAAQHGIALAALTGSGPGGRVVRADVDAAVSALDGRPDATRSSTELAPPTPVTGTASNAVDDSDDVVPLSTIRRLTAQRLTQSTQQAPHFYLTTVIDADALLALRAQINERLDDDGPRISLNDLLIKACAAALRNHPQVNSSWDTTRILRHGRVHIGIAVATDDGLMVPVLHDADRKTLTSIAREAHDLAGKARARHLSPAELSGGTFTISNLGSFGIDHFTAVINPPRAAILAVGAARPQPVVRDGELGVGTIMAVTLSVDHRVLDGATAAAYLADLRGRSRHLCDASWGFAPAGIRVVQAKQVVCGRSRVGADLAFRDG